MPTYEASESFRRQFRNLTPAQQALFRQAFMSLVEDLRAGRRPRAQLRIKRVQALRNQRVFELTWAADGRATFEYGRETREGEPHIVWRAIGTHDILP